MLTFLMRRSRLLALLMIVLPAIGVVADGVRSEFTRIATNEEGAPESLQLAIVTYAPAGGDRDVQVDLVSAVHVGEQAYYAELNALFDDYDALLYELIAPAGTVINPDDRPTGMVSGLQRGMTAMLGLEFQLEEIDYTRPNFVHADLSPKEMSERMAERNESLYVYFWRIVFASLREYSRDPLGMRNMNVLTGSMSSSRQSHPLKIMMANEFANLDRLQDMLGKDADSAVIGARNERAIEVLEREVEAGARRLGIFYGVGHMRDLEDRLLAIGYVPIATRWIDAWAL